jgi:O-antigen ligase
MKSIGTNIVDLAVLFLLGFLLVGTTGFEFFPDAGVFNGKRILEVFTFPLIFLIVFSVTRLRQAFTDIYSMLAPWAAVLLFIALILSLASALRLEHPAYGLLEIAMLVLIVFSVMATAATRRIAGERYDQTVILIIIAIGIMAVVIELAGVLVAWGMEAEFSFKRMLIRFAHPRFYNHLQTFSIPLIACLPFLFPSRNFLKSAAIILLGLQWCLVLISGGRGTFVSVIFALAVTAVLFPIVRRLVIHLAGILLSGVLFLAMHFAQQEITSSSGKLINESVGREMLDSSGRTYMWSVAIDQALRDPLLGSGPAQFSCESSLAMPSHPHNFLLRVLAEHGFPVMGLILAVSAWLGWALLIKSRRKLGTSNNQPVLTAMLFASVLAGAVHACLSGVLIMPASQVMVILVGGWALGRVELSGNRAPSSRKASLVLMAGTFLSVGVAAFSVSELQQMGVRTQDLSKSVYYMPRFWHFGRSCDYSY